MYRIRLHHRRHGASLLVLAAFLAFAPCALASDPDWPSDTDDGWRKVLAYGRCALQVFGAVTPPQWGAAFLDCARLFLAEPPLPGGD
jgi:hypothetical protein